MSTYSPKTEIRDAGGKKFAIVTAQWNSHITFALRDSVVSEFYKSGVTADNIEMFEVPGTVELTYAAARLIDLKRFDAVIVIGCVIRGGTPHFDYVCQSVTQGVTILNAERKCPVIFCVLTVDTEQDAIDRAGGSMGDKGTEAAQTAVMMTVFDDMLKS